jgi:phosphate-selective porin OprO/OprP
VLKGGSHNLRIAGRVLVLCALLAVPAWAQYPAPPVSGPYLAGVQPSVTGPSPIEEGLARELEALRREVAEARGMRQQLDQLRQEVQVLAERSERLPPVTQEGPILDHTPWLTEPCPEACVDGGLPIDVSYRYNAGGGYLHFRTPDDTFTLDIQNQLTADGTFYSLRDPDTFEKGFNIPFYRLYFMGNLLGNWEYLASLQQSLGSFNVLDMYVGYKFADELNVRVGHFLSPFLYEYYAFSPAWEPVITNSPLFQFAGKRQSGAMLWGKLLENSAQYQVGVFNGADGAYFDVDGNVDVLASVTITPFKTWEDSSLQHLGFGFSIQNGLQDYVLSDGTDFNFPFGNGEPTLNQSFVNSTGVIFFDYNNNVAANGNRFKIAPQFFWFGRFSVLAEYLYWTRALTNGVTDIQEHINAFYVNTSYFLTGERYTGDGLLGYTTIEPLNSYGAWELVSQFSQINLGDSSLTPGFAQPDADATRMQQIMAGLNWWPNRYIRISCDYVHVWTDQDVNIGDGQLASQYGIWWGRVAAFY